MNLRLLFPLFLTVVLPSLEAVEIVAGGEPRAVIVVPDKPSAVARYAARELEWHIERATGAKLPILSEGQAAASPLENRIYLGVTSASREAGLDPGKLPPNGFQTKVTAKAVFLSGRDDGVQPPDKFTQSAMKQWTGFVHGAPPLDDSVSMGSLFAVYDWLERQAGVRWLWPGETGTVVPPARGLSGGPEEERTEVRPLIHARPRLSLTPWPGLTKELRDRYIDDTSIWLRRQRFARGVSFEYGHGYVQYWERFGKTHPEYFALRPDGQRAPVLEERPYLVQMCVSNPGLHRQIIEDWLVQRREVPRLPWINGVENDKTSRDPNCVCEACRAWDPPDAPLLSKQAERKEMTGDTSDRPMVSLSDRYARFWLALQAEGQKHDPEATVLGYAYADASAPPVATKLNERIIVGIVPPYAFPLSDENREAFRKLWDGWAKTGARLYLRPNYFLSGYCVPYIFAEEFGEEFRYAARHGMIATDFDSLLGMWGVQGLNLYMMARLNVNPDFAVADILKEYYAGFGAASKEVGAYFDYWKGVTLKLDQEFRDRNRGGWAFVSKAGDEVYTPEAFAQGRELLEKAKAAAERANDTAGARRIAYLDLWLEHAERSMKTLAAFHAHREARRDPVLKEEFEQAQEELDTFRDAHAVEIGNVGVLRKLERWSGWRKGDPETK
ncbi:MAG TPA: DUF4838 domain-containing protein [Chthoniobacteraceae bacterium]|nr:DUF4838 domain-containing protein [Chthoniobacteraceae bacterium]